MTTDDASTAAAAAGETNLHFLIIDEEQRTSLDLPFDEMVSGLDVSAAEFAREGGSLADLPLRIHHKVISALRNGGDSAYREAARFIFYSESLNRFGPASERFFFIGKRGDEVMTFGCDTGADLERHCEGFRTGVVPDLRLDEISAACQETTVELCIVTPVTRIHFPMDQRAVPGVLARVEAERVAAQREMPGVGLMPLLTAVAEHIGAAHANLQAGSHEVADGHIGAAAAHAMTLLAHMYCTRRLMEARYILLHLSPDGVYPLAFMEGEKMLFVRFLSAISDHYGTPQPDAPQPTLH